MRIYDKFYIGGQWQVLQTTGAIDVINPADGENIGKVPAGSAQDAERAILAAREAFPAWAARPVSERLAYVEKLLALMGERAAEFAEVIRLELGAPAGFASEVQVGLGLGDLASYVEVGRAYAAEESETVGNSEIHREPVGVCSFITPWNYPLHQIAVKLAPALIAGCTAVLKPSSETPLNAFLFAELAEAAELPAGVFNLVSGAGRSVGEVLAAHPQVDMVSITGSTASGARIAELAAPTIKRVSQELGGKSALILLDDCPLAQAVPAAVMAMMANSGQTCAALSRVFVPREQQAQAVAIARETAAAVVVGDPRSPNTFMGPLVSQAQKNTVLGYIQLGIDEGATLVCGGVEPPPGLERGAYVQPTIFSDVRNDMLIAREEIFGPVLAILPYDSEEQAIAEANDSDYGLSGGVWSADSERAKKVALQLRTGQVAINGGQFNFAAPFGGYKQSGNGRELGRAGLDEFLELKALNF